MRTILVAMLLSLSPALAQTSLSNDNFMGLYGIVRQALCTLRITCALPADLLLPVGSDNYEREVKNAKELLLMVPPERITRVYSLLAQRFQGDKKDWPRVKILVDASRRKDLAGWERKEFQGYVTVVSGSSQGDDALSTLIGSGLWLIFLQGNGPERLYIVFGNDLWLEPAGPAANQIKPLVRMAIDQIEAISKREKEVR